MSDNITLQRIELLHPQVREEAREIYAQICKALTGTAICRFSYTLRTFEEQEALYAIGRTKPGNKVTNAKSGHSYHNYGLAVDIVLIIGGKTASWDTLKDFDGDTISDWMECVKIFESYGWQWGGRWHSFKDMPHMQKTFGHTIDDLLYRYDTNQFIDGTKYVKI